jgi:hypothetical protein
MSGKQARIAKQAKAMARMYCYPDGSQPGPSPTLEFTLKNVYKQFSRNMLPLLTPLFAQLKPIYEHTGPMRWGGSTAYHAGPR